MIPSTATSEARARLAAEVERRRQLSTSPVPRPGARGPMSTAAEETPALLGAFRAARERTAAAFARFTPQMDAEGVRPCEQHPGVPLPLEREATVRESMDADRYTPVFAACPVCAADARHARRWRKAGVPERVLKATLDTYQTPDASTAEALWKVRQFVARAANRGGFLLLLGTTGTGKGHLATGAAKLLAPDGSLVFLAHADLLTQLRGSYGTGETEGFLDRLKSVRVLILDEFGVSVGGKDEAPVLYQVLATRHDRRLPTILTSNEELQAVRTALGFRLMDRVREDGVVVALTGPSWRTRTSAAD